MKYETWKECILSCGDKRAQSLVWAHDIHTHDIKLQILFCEFYFISLEYKHLQPSRKVGRHFAALFNNIIHPKNDVLQFIHCFQIWATIKKRVLKLTNFSYIHCILEQCCFYIQKTNPPKWSCFVRRNIYFSISTATARLLSKKTAIIHAATANARE